MKIFVPIKHVAETTIKPKIAGDGISVDLSNVKMVVNPFDEFAIEEAIQQVEKNDGEVTLITFGDQDAVQSLRTGLAMGANNAIRILQENTEGESDTRAIAAMLAACMKDKEVDLVICGKHGVGGDNAQVPQMLSVMLGLPVVTSVSSLEISDDSLKATRQIEGKAEVVKVSMPAVVSLDKGVNEPRYPKLKGIMKAKKAKIEEIDPASLDIDQSIIGSEGSQVTIESIELPPSKGAGVKVEVGDDPQAAAEQLVEWLKNEAKVL
jgi:electron transfer flavoprotein beta subunit